VKNHRISRTVFPYLFLKSNKGMLSRGGPGRSTEVDTRLSGERFDRPVKKFPVWFFWVGDGAKLRSLVRTQAVLR
jgi:hypothetical protein